MDLLDDFRHRLSGRNPDIERRLTTDPLRLAQLYEAQFGRRALLARIEHHVPSVDFQPGEAHRRLREIPWAAIVTTNYDDLLERAFESMRPLRRVVTDEDLTGRRPPNELVVIKLHGDLTRPDTIYAHLADHQRRTLLMMALEGGTDTLRIDATPIDIVDELLKTRLPSDERARVHLYHARLLRDLGRSADAARALIEAEESNPRKEIQARIALEVRELAFQDGDKARLEVALRRPLADDADVLERCRRGSDCLLLGQIGDADRWYREAFDRATTGDERVAALWGRLISTRRGRLIEETEEERLRSAEIRHDLRSVPEVDQPASVHAREFAEQAGTALLDGKGRELAVERLQAYLDEMRRLGWPHSPTHDLRAPMEIAAHQCARLLLEGDDSEEGDDNEEDIVRRVIEALVTLNRYGLANYIPELFKDRHCELLSRTPQSVAWFRNFVGARPTLPRCADARLATAVAGIALLDDDAIDATVASVIERIDAWLADASAGRFSRSLERLWQDVVDASHHLPAGAARRMLEAYGRYLLDWRATVRLGSPPMSELWLQQGFLERGGPEARVLAERGRAALEKAVRVPRNFFWLREITNCLAQAAEDGLLGNAERAVLQNAVRVVLEAEPVHAVPDDNTDLELAVLLAALHPDGRIEVPAFAARARGFVQNARSASLGLALHCAEAALDAMPMADRDALLQALCDIGEQLITGTSDDGDEDRGAESLARTLAAVAGRAPAARDRIASLLFRLAERHASALVGLGRLPALSPEECARSAAIAEAALFSASAARRDRVLLSITGWLHSGASPAAAERILEVALGLCLSDAPETRERAIYAVAHFFRVNAGVITALRSRARRIVSELAVHDPAWSARIRALDSLPHLCATLEERAAIDSAIASMSESLVALERRVRTAVRRRLVSAAASSS